MQMVMMVFRTSLEQEILPWVEREELPYTRLDGATGAGRTGAAMGSLTWEGDNIVLLLALPDDRLNGFRERVRKFEDDVIGPQRGGTPFHIFLLPCIQWV